MHMKIIKIKNLQNKTHLTLKFKKYYFLGYITYE